MSFEIGLTTWLRLMIPLKMMVISSPEPIVPGSGWASGIHLIVASPAP